MSFEQTLDIYLKSHLTRIIPVAPEEEQSLSTVKVIGEYSLHTYLIRNLRNNLQFLSNCYSPTFL